MELNKYTSFYFIYKLHTCNLCMEGVLVIFWVFVVVFLVVFLIVFLVVFLEKTICEKMKMVF